MTATRNKRWPILTSYDQRHLGRIALPLGGIGTGSVSLGGRGNLQDWEIMNRPAKGFNGGEGLFLLYAKPKGGQPVVRGLEGLIAPPYEGDFGLKVPYHGVPRFRHCSFAAAYPLGQVSLSDPAVPLDVRIEAFNPFIPADADNSSWPVAVLRYVLINPTDQPVQATVCGTMANYIGNDGQEGECKANVNTFRQENGLRGLFMTSEGVDPTDPAWGTMALATTSPSVTFTRDWRDDRWRGVLLHFWDDLQDGQLVDTARSSSDIPLGALAAQVTVPPRGQIAVTFLLSWHFPNRQTWTPCTTGSCSCASGCDSDRIGNYYCTQFTDAWDVAEQLAPRLPELEAQTLRFVHAFCESDLPAVVKQAALYNLSTLRTQTCFRTEDGRFFGWEGCCDDAGCCHGSCTHVWNYEQGTALPLASWLARCATPSSPTPPTSAAT